MPQNDCHIENPVNIDNIYQKDCFAVSLSFVTNHATLLGSISIGIASVMVSNKNIMLLSSRNNVISDCY